VDDANDATPPAEVAGVTGWMLGIDTSADLVSVALARIDSDANASTSDAELMWPAARNQTTTLLHQIDHLLNLCGIESDAITSVAVAIGPGGFNALRVGMSVAKGFAFAYGLPIVGVGTLDAVAYPFARWGMPIRAFVPAGRGRVVYGDYQEIGGAPRLHSEMAHRAPADLAADLLTPTVLAGDLTIEDAALLAANQNAVLPAAGLRRRSASHIIDLALMRLASGTADDLTDLEPLYVHQRATEDIHQQPARGQQRAEASSRSSTSFRNSTGTRE
jgi:tRNA threonylcarbamoyladenosine biosynthesis protein TsaB